MDNDLDTLDVAQDGHRQRSAVHEAYGPTELGRAIKRLRRARGMTQASLAEWLDVSRQTVVPMEQGGPVAVTVVMRAIALLGSKVVITPKGVHVEVVDP
jgi:DNA-binding XRE family transcriptional regulator